MLKKTIRGCVKKLQAPRSLVTSSDVFVVSYPKSGNTWLRFLLSNYFVQYFSIPLNVNWFTVQGLIPDVQVYRNLPANDLISSRCGYRLLKTHADYEAKIKRAVVLVRNPEDALLSCYKYFRLNGKIQSGLSLRQFVEEHPQGLNGWINHTNGWVGQYRIGSVIRFYRFEDLRRNPHETMAEIIDLLGLEVCDDILNSAIEASSLEAMAVSEKKHRSNAALNLQNERFVGQAKVGGGAEVMNDELIALIRENTAEIRSNLGYNK
ncbi:sulfotransferase domain-containing protein [Roseibacillus persicicus]|uniref:sulfotransferase domain-containing protein n=1 Tax=Roseibacillus persicicus TaxID=454148 RepID=UPI00280F1960|nr:sulfotransferase domain-containing protein [Roseibacillus persicicus]MDQ8188855.1 sulfotransferase domain-containing protein [Roseibacillus persicicus]